MGTSDAKLPDSQTGHYLGISRGRLEERFIPNTVGKEVPPEEEIRALLHTLIKWAEKEGIRAKNCRSIARAQRRGRPRKPTLNALALDAQLLADTPKSPVKPGRKLGVDISDQALLKQLEARRSSFRSERAALRELVAEYLVERQKRSSGSDAERLTANLQKRVAKARAIVRKSSSE